MPSGAGISLGVLRQGAGEPLVLYHGIIQSERVWHQVVPLLADEFEVIVPTALGHHGGPEPISRPATIADVIDDAERVLDELGLERAHLAGNSLGGWTALELAGRGRALSVCALSPAGLWGEVWDEEDRVTGILRATLRDAPRSRRILPLLTRSSRFRRWALRSVAVNGDRVTREDILSRGRRHDRLPDRRGAARARPVARPGRGRVPDHDRLVGRGPLLSGRGLPGAGRRAGPRRHLQGPRRTSGTCRRWTTRSWSPRLFGLRLGALPPPLLFHLAAPDLGVVVGGLDQGFAARPAEDPADEDHGEERGSRRW